MRVLEAMQADLYAQNIEAIEKIYPELAEQIKDHKDSFQIKIDKMPAGDCALFQKVDGQWRTFHSEKDYFQENAFVEMNRCIVDINKLNAGFIFYGMDAGLRLLYLFDNTSKATAVFVVEKYTEIFKAVISAFDMRAMLDSRRVFFFLGEQAAGKMVKFLENDFNMMLPLKDFIFSRKEDLDYYSAVRKQITEKIKDELLAFYKDKEEVDSFYLNKTKEDLLASFNPEKRKKLKILGELSTKTSFMQYSMLDCLKGFENLGHEIDVIKTDTGSVVVRYLYKILSRHRPHLHFKINHTSREGFIASPTSLITVTWMQDYMPYILNPEIKAEEKINSYDQFLLSTKYYISDLKKVGFPESKLHLFHFASDTERYRPMELNREDRQKYGSDISFVANYPDFKPAYTRLSAEMADALIERMKKEDLYYPDDFLRFYEEAANKFGKADISKDSLLVYVWTSLSTIALRIAYLESIADMDLAIYGAGWDGDHRFAKNARGRVQNGEEVCKIFNAAKININMHVSTNNHNRVFDVIASGGFLLTRWTAEDDSPGGIGDLFEVGKEIEVFRNKKELREKIKYYLSHDAERKEIAQRGYQRLLKEHTVELRMQKVLDIVYEGLTREE